MLGGLLLGTVEDVFYLGRAATSVAGRKKVAGADGWVK